MWPVPQTSINTLICCLPRWQWGGKLENANCFVHSQMETKVAIARFLQSRVLLGAWCHSGSAAYCGASVGKVQRDLIFISSEHQFGTDD